MKRPGFAGPALCAAAFALFWAAGSDAAPTPAPLLSPTVFSSPAPAPPAPTPSPVPARPLRFMEADRAVAAGRAGVDAELGTLDGGVLTRSLRRAARAGRRLRLLLDPYDKDSRAQGPPLAALPSVQVRWRAGLSIQRRWMHVAGVGQLVWKVGGRPAVWPSPKAAPGFEKAWACADRGIPKELVLRDQLDALPDPRERAPHYVRRDLGANPEGSHAKHPHP